MLYHRSNVGYPSVERDEVLIEEIGRTYKGKVVVGRDLDVF